DDLRVLRDSIAKTQGELDSRDWERFREVSGHIKELKDRCAEAGHSLIISLAGKPGTRRRLMRNRRDEKRTCLMCGSEEIGKLANGLFSRLLFRRADWKFEKLNGHVTRFFDNAEWYFETVSVIRQFSFGTDVVLHHAFPPRLPESLLNGN